MFACLTTQVSSHQRSSRKQRLISRARLEAKYRERTTA